MTSGDAVNLTESQEAGLGYLLEGKENIFLTGGPGTGKSFLIAEYLKREKKEVPVIASTGSSAILVGGRTFHSFFRLGIMQGGVQATLERALKDRRLKKRLKNVSTVVIDEVSMLSSEALICAETIARRVRKCDEPWGGIRIITVGDFAQLPPVSQGSKRDWCFLGEVWARSKFRKVILNEVKRTEDQEFLEILEDIRWAKKTTRVSEFLNSRLTRDEKIGENVPRVFPRRAQTDAFNIARLTELKDSGRSYKTVYDGDPKYIERLMKDAPIPPVLELKNNALVMLRTNDSEQRFVNGTVGIVVKMKDSVIVVKVNGQRIKVEPFKFSILNADGEEAATARNFPMTLAYANTIHKVQGTTLDRIHVSLKGLWEPGQAYVALSRARSSQGITLMDWDENSIQADPVVRTFYGAS